MDTQTPMTLMDFIKAAKAGINEVSPEQLQALHQSTPNLLVLDVRESSEYEQGHIEGSVLIPRGILEAAADPQYPKHVPALSADRERPIALYCATGGRSAMAASTLQLMGYSRVFSLDGGFTRWSGENLPVEKDARYV